MTPAEGGVKLEPMKLLIIGGSRFVGRHLAAAAIERGHDLTLFNRGSRSDLFPEAEQLTSDRNADLSLLKDRRWDVVIDTCGYTPRPVRQSAEVLKDALERYLFISTISVYADQNTPFQDEDAPLATLQDETTEEVTGETYGGLKVLCEKAVLEVFPERCLILRPGLVVGPHDPTDRFTYWPERVASGGEVLAPESPALPVQFIDARDLAEFALILLEAQQTGTYNVVSNPEQFSMGDVLETSKRASASDARFTWVGGEFLSAQGVQPFTELPLWLPGEEQNFARISNERALDAGLSIRPLEETVEDTLQWAKTRPADEPRKAGLTREREAELLKLWHESH